MKSHLDEVLGLIEVPVSGRVSFVTYQENPLNRVGHPEIVAVSNLCSIDIENAFEEVIQGDILNVDKFYFSMIKKLEVWRPGIQAELLPDQGAKAHSVQNLY